MNMCNNCCGDWDGMLVKLTFYFDIENKITYNRQTQIIVSYVGDVDKSQFAANEDKLLLF